MGSAPALINHDLSRASWPTLGSCWLLAVLSWCAIPLSPQSVDSDFWGHVQYGWDSWQHGLARTATYTYTAADHRWINHENLSELIFALAAHGPGVSSLLVLKCFLGCGVLYLAMRQAGRQGVHPLTLGITSVVGAMNLSFYWGLRPHVFTFVFFAVLIAWTDRCFDGWPSRRTSPGSGEGRASADFRRLHQLWLVPLLLLVWANTHGGFLAGLAVTLVLFGGRATEFVWVRGARRWHVACYLFGLIAASGLATLVNPYGPDLHRWLISALSVPRPEIQEWHPPDLWSGGAIRLWVLLALSVAGLAASQRRRDLTQMAVLLLVCAQAFRHQRHLPFVAILFLFWLPAHLESAANRWIQHFPRRTAPPPLPLRQLGTLLLLLFSGLLAWQLGGRLVGVPVARNQYPVSALQYLADQRLTGRMVVSGHWAQYVLGVAGSRRPGDPGIQVAFDGRFRTCYPQEVVDLHFDFFAGPGGRDKRYRSPSSPPADPKRILQFHDPQLVLVNQRHSLAIATLKSQAADWVLLYQDQLAQLWGRRSVFDDHQLESYLAPERRQVVLLRQQGSVPWPAAPRPPGRVTLAQSLPSLSPLNVWAPE